MGGGVTKTTYVDPSKTAYSGGKSRRRPVRRKRRRTKRRAVRRRGLSAKINEKKKKRGY